VFCLSRSFTNGLRENFGAVVCIEIHDTRAFCGRIEAALPPEATFPGSPDRPRIGRRVDYYQETESSNPRWALPDKIATSKFNAYAWQDEFRLVFCLADALEFEKVELRIVQNNCREVPKDTVHQFRLVKAGSLRDISELYRY
jgi:hypothetical protein